MEYLPEIYKERMKKLLQEDFDAYIESFQQPRLYGLRVNTSKISVEDFLALSPFPLERIPWISNGFYYSGSDQPSKHPYYFAGLYYLQEPSAMTPASRLPVNQGEKVLDLCAAPGGKATELGVKLAGEGLLIANDISNSRAKALLKNLELFGVGNLMVTSETPERLETYFPEYFDKILIDAPCSGEGMFRKDGKMVKSWEEHGPEFYAKLQKSILDTAVRMLKPGGLLLYSTCTFSPEEDEESVQFLLDQGECQVVPMEWYEHFSKGEPSFIENGSEELNKCARIWPHRIAGEGHFLALLKKGSTSTEGGILTKSVKNRSLKTNLNKEQEEVFSAFCEKLSRTFEPGRLECRNDKIYYMPEGLKHIKGLRFLRTGLFLGECKKRRFEPSQPLAMALKAEEYKECLKLSVSDPRVLKYLKGETLELTQEEYNKKTDWMLVCVDEFPLGWGKNVNGILRNKYSQGWRWQ